MNEAVKLEDLDALLRDVRMNNTIVYAVHRLGEQRGWSREETLARTVVALSDECRDLLRGWIAAAERGIPAVEPRWLSAVAVPR